jgi:phospholipid/cholesterol/gamma-HCH transport system substrate-binding protein
MRKIFIFIFSIGFVHFTYFFKVKELKYSFFIEFNNANGLVIGTPIKMRGVQVGSIKNMQLKHNCVLVLAEIHSHKIRINKGFIIETTQTGLLNDSVIDIIPLNISSNSSNISPLSFSCDSSQIICHNAYIIGDRGLNYDDLVRSTTRISQRFDDPNLFYLFYQFLKSSLELTEAMSIFCKNFMSSLNS